MVEPPLTALFARPEVAFSRLLVEQPRELVPVVGCRCFPTNLKEVYLTMADSCCSSSGSQPWRPAGSSTSLRP